MFSEQTIIKVRLFSEVHFIHSAILNEGNDDLIAVDTEIEGKFVVID